MPTNVPFSAKKFADAIRDPEAGVPSGIVGPDNQVSQRRFSVYRNNVVSSLIDAMAANFPAIERIVGEEFFRAVAGIFVRKQPPKVPMLFRYGGDFAKFLEGFEPVKSMPYLSDVARVEYSWLQAYHAADENVVDAEMLQNIAPEDLANLTFIKHPACHIISSFWPVVTIVSKNRNSEDCFDIDMTVSETALIGRPILDVDLRALPAGGAVFLEHLLKGGNLGNAASEAMLDSPEFDLSNNIGGMLAAGVFKQMKVPQPEH